MTDVGLIQELVAIVTQNDTEDAIFGLYWKDTNGLKQLAVNGGDWLDDEDELIDLIEGWCETNEFEVEWEAEADDAYFIGMGYEKVY